MIPPVDAAETVVLLHGLGRTRWSMAPLARGLQRAGFRTRNASYPSRTCPLETLATEWLPERLRAVDADSPVHLVTHSMGGIVVRLWLRKCPAPANLGRVVMLAPPNAGSEVADRLRSFPPFRWFTGLNGQRLGTAADAVPPRLGPWPAEAADLGIIAGTRSIDPWTAGWLPKPHDGKVSVASTHLAGERDHVTVPFSHTWLGWRSETLAHVAHFLRHGTFARPVPGDSPPRGRSAPPLSSKSLLAGTNPPLSRSTLGSPPRELPLAATPTSSPPLSP